MFRTTVVAILAVLALGGPAWAQGKLKATPSVVMPLRSTSTPMPASLPFVVATKPFTVTPSGAIVLDPAPVFVPDPRHHRHGTPTFISSPTQTQVVVVPQPVPQVVYQTVYVAPQQCVTQGYWSYRWVPYTTTQNVWVPGSWGADGAWMDSHWEARPYSSGYYDPFWVPAQSYSC
jgi:hypothetical protein